MSDAEDIDLSESSEGEDFSGSEDDWVPNKKDAATESTDDEDDDFEDTLPVASTSRIIKQRRLNATVQRSRTQNRNPAGTAKKTTKTGKKANDDSESSGDDYLVDPNKIDLSSKFFAPSTSKASDTSYDPPMFDCNAGMHLSDSDNSDDELEEVATTAKAVPINFNKHEDFNQNLHRAKEYLANFRSSNFGKDDSSVDVTELLAMGETTKPPKNEPPLKKRKANVADSDSDWEEVTEKEKAIEDVIVTVGPTIKPKLDRTQLELELSIKRKINRRKKENQVYVHKVHILAWIAHGNYVNKILNNTKLMEMCLAFMPSKQCYPKDRTDVNYFEQIAKWYQSQMALKSDKMYPALTRLPPLPVSLALQIKTKSAICKKDYIYVFIILLRAIGIQCRLVLNLVAAPIRPPTNELCSIKTKPTETKIQSASKNVKHKTAVDSPKKSGTETKKTRTKSTSDSATKASVKSSVHLGTNSSDEVLTKRSPLSTKGSTLGANQTKQTPEKSLSSSTLSLRDKLATTKSKLEVKTQFVKEPTSSKIKSKSDVRKVELSKDNKANATFSKTSGTKSHEQSPSKQNTSTGAYKTPIKPKQSTDTSTGSPHFSKTTHLNVMSSPIARRTRSKSTENQEKAEKPPSITKLSRKVVDKRANVRRPPQLDGGDDKKLPKRKPPNLDKLKKPPEKTAAAKKFVKKRAHARSDDDDDSDFVASPIKKKVTPKSKIAPSKTSSNKKIDRRVLSTDDEETLPKKKGIDIWVEVYSEYEDKWIAIDLFKLKINSVDVVRGAATKPISYVFGWNNNNSIKDVSSRYCSNWNTVTRKLRVEPAWLNKALKSFKEMPTAKTRAEDRELNKIHLKEPLPTVISEYKDHPLYALERHLLKFQAIYPRDALTLGFVRKEPVYARECVHTLHSREIWVKQALVVKPGEKPYKIVKARPKWDRLTNKMLEPQPLEIFGSWQTQKYEPPTAENGIVPRNAYGNVELFKPEMLPKKTVHLQLEGLNKTCKKMNIDCAQAVVGFDFHSGYVHPTFDGFVVCEEFSERVVEQWLKDQEEAQRKEEEKINQRVYGNWKKLIRGLLIRERLQRKYKFADADNHDEAGAVGKSPSNKSDSGGATSSNSATKRLNRKRK